MVPVEAPQRHARLGVAPPGHAKALVVQVGVPPRGVPGPLLVLARVSALVPVPAWVRMLAPVAPVAPRPSLTPVLALMPMLTLVPVPAPVPVAVPLEAMVPHPRSPLSSRASASSRQPASSVLLSVTFGTLPLPFLSCASTLPLPFPASRPSSLCVIVMVPPTGLPSGTCSVLVPLPEPDGCLVSCPALPSVPTPRTSTAFTAAMRHAARIILGSPDRAFSPEADWQLHLPTAQGGFGLPSVSRSLPAAALASWSVTFSMLRPHLSTSPFLGTALATPAAIRAALPRAGRSLGLVRAYDRARADFDSHRLTGRRAPFALPASLPLVVAAAKTVASRDIMANSHSRALWALRASPALLVADQDRPDSASATTALGHQFLHLPPRASTYPLCIYIRYITI